MLARSFRGCGGSTNGVIPKASGEDKLMRFLGSNIGRASVSGTKRRVARSRATFTTPCRLKTKSENIVRRNETLWPLKE